MHECYINGCKIVEASIMFMLAQLVQTLLTRNFIVPRHFSNTLQKLYSIGGSHDVKSSAPNIDEDGRLSKVRSAFPLGCLLALIIGSMGVYYFATLIF
jgi:hypothetical protein